MRLKLNIKDGAYSVVASTTRKARLILSVMFFGLSAAVSFGAMKIVHTPVHKVDLIEKSIASTMVSNCEKDLQSYDFNARQAPPNSVRIDFNDAMSLDTESLKYIELAFKVCPNLELSSFCAGLDCLEEGGNHAILSMQN